MPQPVGAWGVDIFFVISGAVMALSTSERTIAPAFLVRRIERIAPLYWLVTTAKVGALIAVPAAFALRLDLAHVLTSYAFIPWPDQTGEVHPVVYVGWSLVYEVWFYVLFALCRFNVRNTAFAMLTIVVAGVDPLALEFVGGLAIGTALKGERWGVPFAVFAVVAFLPESRACYWGVPAMLVVAIGVRAERWCRFGLLSKLGDASYSIYLTHSLVLPTFVGACAALSVPGPAVIATALIAAAGLGHFTRVYIEPALRFPRLTRLVTGHSQI